MLPEAYLVPTWEKQLLDNKSDVLSITFDISPEARNKIALTKPIFSSSLVVGVLDKGKNWDEAALKHKKISVSKLYGKQAIELAEN